MQRKKVLPFSVAIDLPCSQTNHCRSKCIWNATELCGFCTRGHDCSIWTGRKERLCLKWFGCVFIFGYVGGNISICIMNHEINKLTLYGNAGARAIWLAFGLSHVSTKSKYCVRVCVCVWICVHYILLNFRNNLLQLIRLYVFWAGWKWIIWNFTIVWLHPFHVIWSDI